VEISTFATLLRFAMDLERQAEEFYRSLAAKIRDPWASELFSGYAREYARRLKLLEGIRQRDISEVLLEPISGMDSRQYVVATNVNDRMDIETASNAALDIETKFEAFYKDSLRVAGAVLGEAGRVFRKLSEENRERRKVLSSLKKN